MSTNYAVNINMSQDTVNALTNQGFFLYGFKTVATSLKGGAPLVWFSTQDFGLATAVNWSEQYQAFTTRSDAIANGTVTATNAYDIDLDSTLNITNSSGSGAVTTIGTPLAIGINNQTATPFTCGISQVQAGVPMALCAFPLNGNMLDVIAPIEKVLFMFGTQSLNTGAVIYQAFSQAVLIDLTANPIMSVSFDIDAGWGTDSNPAVSTYPANTNLVPFLIETPNAAAEILKRRLQVATQ